MGEASSTSTLRTLMPSGGVCGVFSIMPRICFAAASAPAGSSASLIPPPLPRPPAWTCALTTTLPPRRWAISFACAGVSATSPLGTATPNSRSSAFAWYSWTFIPLPSARVRATEARAQERDHRLPDARLRLRAEGHLVNAAVEVLRLDRLAELARGLLVRARVVDRDDRIGAAVQDEEWRRERRRGVHQRRRAARPARVPGADQDERLDRCPARDRE